jgi:hypothetical protein
MGSIFFQMVLFLAGVVIGVVTPLLPKLYQKIVAGVLSIILISVASLWIGYRLGSQQYDQNIVLAFSTFETGIEDWTIDGGGTGPFYKTSGGNTGGYLLGNEVIGEYPDWWWIAPSKFLGDKSEAYRGILYFDLAQNDITQQVMSTVDVVLVGNNIQLTYDINNPGREWTTYAIGLHESAGWKNEIGGTATQGEMQRVLSSLIALKIHAEYREGDDSGSLDNVILLRRP